MIKTLARQSAIYGISTILGRLLSYLLTPYYTRIFLPSEYGVITDLYALIPFILIILSLSMESSYFRYAAKEEEAGGTKEAIAARKKRLFASMWGLNILLGSIFILAVWLFQDSLNWAMGETYIQNPNYILIIAGIIFLDVASALPFARLRKEKKAGRYVTLKLLNIVLQVAFALLFGFLGYFESDFGVGWVFIANILASLLTLAVLLPSSSFVLPRLEKSLLPILMTYSLALTLSGVAATATDFIDRQLIKFLIPLDSMAQLGIYGAITKIAVVMTLFTQMYRLAAEPFFLSSFKEADFKQANAEAMKYYIIFTVAIFLFISLFQDIFALIVGRDFREGLNILPIVLISNLLMGVWLNLSFWYKRQEKTKFALLITLFGMLISISANILLLPSMGFAGAAWARFFAEIAMVALSYCLMRIYCPIAYNWRSIGEYAFLGAAIYGLYAFLSKAANGGALGSWWMMAFCVSGVSGYIVYAIWREKIDLKALVKSVLRRK